MKQNSSFLRTLACLLLIGCTVLCGCPAPSDGGTTGTTTTTTTTTGGSQNPDAPTPTVYGNGGAIEGTGDRLASDAPILTAPSYSTEGATEKTAAQMRAILRNANGVAADTVYVTTDKEAIGFIGANDRAYDGKGSVIVSKGGFLIDDCANIVIRNITLVGPALIQKSTNVTFENVKFVCADGTALKADAESTKLYVKSSRIDASVAAENSAVDFYLLDSYISFAANGILDLSAKNLYVRGNRFVGTADSAIKTASQDAEIRKNTITLPATSTAIEIGETKNILVAENIIKDAQKAVLMIGADNSVIVRNSLISVEMKNSKHAYICDNAMGGKITVSDIDYILADGNIYPDDEYNHTTDQIGITNSNGDSLMDVSENAYLSAGANENLLPHVDRDQFFGEERKTVVRDPDGEMEISDYVSAHAKEEAVVIVAPGAYTMLTALTFRAEHKNTALYAYGVFAEASKDGIKYTEEGYATTTKKLNPIFYMRDTENVTVKGGTYGYAYQGHAQAHVLEKIPNSSDVILKASAGFIKEVGEVEGDLFWYTTYGFRAGEPWSYGDINHLKAVMQEDGTVRMTFRKEHYDIIEVGDVITTRPKGGYHAVNTDYSKNVWYQDITVFGSMAATCFHEYHNESSITYFRCADTYRAGMQITKEIYDEYKALEQTMHKKGYTDFTTEVWYDEAHGCSRGPAFRNGSLDGVHVVESRGGAQIRHSLFERLGDDGTNQFGGHSRLSAIRENGDGTMDIIYKGNTSEYAYNTYIPASRTPHGISLPFKAGDKMVIYTIDGRLVLIAHALTATEKAHRLKNDPELIAAGGNDTFQTYHVKVKIEEYHPESLDPFRAYLDEYTDDRNAVMDSVGYNGYESKYKVFVHQSGYACDGALLDNVKYSCGKANGALLRVIGGRIKNSTFEHIGSNAIKALYDDYWGESAIVQDMLIENNIISHTGYRFALNRKEENMSPVVLDAPGEMPLDAIPIYRNITIRGNVFQNRTSGYAMFLDSLSNVVIENNDFGRKNDMEGAGGRNVALYIRNSLNVKIEGNKYPNPTTPIKMAIIVEKIRGLTGKDVNNGDMFPECK